MDEAALRILLDQLAAGEVDADEVVRRLRRQPFAELGYAMVDHHRSLRQGLPEAIFGPGKSVDHCVGIVGELLTGDDGGHGGGGPVVLSRATDDQIAAVLAAWPGGVVTGSTVVWRPAASRSEGVVVVTAGTADLMVAEECRATLRAFGFEAALVADAGVAGLHRLLAHADLLQAADAVVVVAGMEGALASVVGGLCSAPVVAVPTSIGGYGAGLGRGHRPAGHAGLVRGGRGGGRHRQRFRCRLRGVPHPGSAQRCQGNLAVNVTVVDEVPVARPDDDP